MEREPLYELDEGDTQTIEVMLLRASLRYGCFWEQWGQLAEGFIMRGHWEKAYQKAAFTIGQLVAPTT